MSEVDRLNAEFSAIGETEVARRLDSRGYSGTERVYAMRWLNEKAMERSAQVSSAAQATGSHAQQAALIRKADNAATFAAAGAAIAAVASVVSAGVALKVLNTTDAMVAGQQQLLADSHPPAGQMAEADPPGPARHHRHGRPHELAR